MSPIKNILTKKIILSIISINICIVFIVLVTLAWFINHQNPAVDSINFVTPEDIVANFSTWYKPYSEINNEGIVTNDTTYRIAQFPLSGDDTQDEYGWENTDVLESHTGVLGHNYEYIRPGDKFMFLVQLERKTSTNRTLQISFNNIRPVSLSYGIDGNATGIGGDPYVDPTDALDISCLFKSQVLYVSASDDDNLPDANTMPASSLSQGSESYLNNTSDYKLSLPMDGSDNVFTWDSSMPNKIDVYIELSFLDYRQNIGVGNLSRSANDYQGCSLRIDTLQISSALVENP